MIASFAVVLVAIIGPWITPSWKRATAIVTLVVATIVLVRYQVIVYSREDAETIVFPVEIYILSPLYGAALLSSVLAIYLGPRNWRDDRLLHRLFSSSED